MLNFLSGLLVGLVIGSCLGLCLGLLLAFAGRGSQEEEITQAYLDGLSACHSCYRQPDDGLGHRVNFPTEGGSHVQN